MLEMIQFALLLGAATLVLATFWQDIVDWLRKAIEGLKRIIKGILYGTKVFIKKIGEFFQEISRHYSKNGTQWSVTTQTKEVSEYDIPDDIRMRAERSNELDITDELEMQLA